MRTVGWIGMFALAFVVPSPVRGQAPRRTPDEFRSGFNGALSDSGLTMRLAAWKLDGPGSLSLTALVAPNIRAFAQMDRVRRLSSVEGLKYRAIHPGSDTPVMALVSWNPGTEPANPFAF